MNLFKSLATKPFLSWEKDNPNHTMAASLAYARVFKARSDLREFEVVANRTEGMPRVSVDIGNTDDKSFKVDLKTVDMSKVDEVIKKHLSR